MISKENWSVKRKMVSYLKKNYNVKVKKKRSLEPFRICLINSTVNPAPIFLAYYFWPRWCVIVLFSIHQLLPSLKFGYSEEATKFEKIFHLKFDATQYVKLTVTHFFKFCGLLRISELQKCLIILFLFQKVVDAI